MVSWTGTDQPCPWKRHFKRRNPCRHDVRRTGRPSPVMLTRGCGSPPRRFASPATRLSDALPTRGGPRTCGPSTGSSCAASGSRPRSAAKSGARIRVRPQPPPSQDLALRNSHRCVLRRRLLAGTTRTPAHRAPPEPGGIRVRMSSARRHGHVRPVECRQGFAAGRVVQDGLQVSIVWRRRQSAVSPVGEPPARRATNAWWDASATPCCNSRSTVARSPRSMASTARRSPG